MRCLDPDCSHVVIINWRAHDRNYIYPARSRVIWPILFLGRLGGDDGRAENIEGNRTVSTVRVSDSPPHQSPSSHGVLWTTNSIFDSIYDMSQSKNWLEGLDARYSVRNKMSRFTIQPTPPNATIATSPFFADGGMGKVWSFWVWCLGMIPIKSTITYNHITPIVSYPLSI